MTKKIFAMFLAVLMVVSLLPTSVFAADATCPGKGNDHTLSNCEHTAVKVTEPTCSKQGYTTYVCNTCGDTFVADFVAATGEHNWEVKDIAPTCTEPGYIGAKVCADCGATEGGEKVDALGGNGYGHVYGDWSTLADCTKGGTITRTCELCGYVDSNEIEEGTYTEHRFGSWELTTPATAEANGEATHKCRNCDTTETIVVYYAHDHNGTTLRWINEVAPGCETAGVKAHYECQVCGVLLDTNYKEVTAEDLAIPSHHAEKLSCVVTTATCEYCNKIIKLEQVEHNYGEWQEAQAATCTKDGYLKRTCTICKTATETKNIPALGHLEASTTVEATCNSYGYTFTYCMRANCPEALKTSTTVDKLGSFDLTSGNGLLTEPADSVGFYLTVNVDGTMKYWDGYFYSSNKFMEVKDDISKAKLVTAEKTDDGWYLSYDFDGTKYYINLGSFSESSSTGKFAYSETANTVWKWDADYGMFTAVKGSTEYYLGTYTASWTGTTYSSVCLSKKSFITEENNGKTQFPAQMTVSNANGVHLLKIDVDVDGGFNAENHKYEIYSAATCQNGGLQIKKCVHCEKMTDEIVAGDNHDWKKVDAECVSATCTTDGKNVYKCDTCGQKKGETVAATGHHSVDEEDEFYWTHEADHLDRVSYEYYVCDECGVQFGQTNYKIWEYNSGYFDNLNTAIANHAHSWDEDWNMVSGLIRCAGKDVKGNCTTVGYEAYTCPECDQTIYVKLSDEHGVTGSHNWDRNDVAATCTTDGKWYNLKCTRCGELRDKTKDEYNAEKDNYVVVPATGHTIDKTNEKYSYDCANPNYYNVWKYQCATCKAQVFDDTEALGNYYDKNYSFGYGFCTGTRYEYYHCACGEDHIRSWAGNYGHVLVDVKAADLPEGFAEKKATCLEAGYTWQYCQYCDSYFKKEVAQLKHQNADKVEFTNDCTATGLKDTYCVLCNTEYKPDHVYGEWNYVDSNDICGLPYKYRVCSVCYETDAEECHKTTDGEDIVLSFGGHRPASVWYNKRVDRVYENVRVNLYRWSDAYEEVYDEETDTLYHVLVGKTLDCWISVGNEFIAYTAPTYTSKGYAKFVCAACGETVEMELDALSGLSFDLDIVNGTDNSDDFYYGSLVEVTVSAESFNTGLYNFKSSLSYNSAYFQYVGYEALNDNFDFRVTNPGKEDVADGEITITGAAAGEKKDVVISEKTPMIKLYFRVSIDERWINWLVEEQEYKLSEAKAEYAEAVEWLLANSTEATFRFVPGQVYNAENKAVNVDTASKNLSETIGVSAFMDVDDNGHFGLNDLGLGIDLITEGKYSVALDINQDGELTLEDVNLAYNYLAGNYTYKEILKMCLSEAETNILFPEAE